MESLESVSPWGTHCLQKLTESDSDILQVLAKLYNIK